MSRSRSTMTPLKATVAGGGLFVVYVVLKFELALRIVSTPDTLSSALLAGMLQLLALAVVMILIRQLELLNACLTRVHLKRPLEWIGKCSLQLYLLHLLVLELVKDWPLSWPVKLILIFVIGIAVSSGLLRLVKVADFLSSKR